MLEQLRKDECVLLCIDYQDRLLPKIHMADEITRNATIMIRAAQALKIPIIVTEQYPEGLGRTVQNLVETLGGEYRPIEKNSFDCFRSSTFVKKLGSAKAKSILTMGVEAHVCVCQTVLEALRRKHHVYFLEDATSSRSAENRKIAFDRMAREGAIPSSVEMAIYELLKVSGTPEFKEILEYVR